MKPFVYSDAGVALTKQFEGLRLTAYQDVGGVWTIGYGHTGPEVHAGLVWTQAQADAALLEDLASAVACVNEAVDADITQNEFDAMVDFVFNDGAHAFRNSTLLKMVNLGHFESAAEQFLLWDHAGGKVVEGLLHRRQAEAALFSE